MLKDVKGYLQHAVKTLRNKNHFGFPPDKTVLNGLILGTGWGDTIKLENAVEFPLTGLCDGFRTLQDLPGHARSLVYGRFAGKEVLVLRGRVHLNESPSDRKIPIAVRLQTQILMELGVRTLIVTNAAGSLNDDLVRVGDVMVINGFVSLWAPDMPLWGGEFVSPNKTLDPGLADLALSLRGDLQSVYGGKYAMVCGPNFETYEDKLVLRGAGASAVGMSTLPEACIAALPQYEAKVLGLSFITNTMHEHSHEGNMARAKESGAKLGAFLTRIVEALPDSK